MERTAEKLLDASTTKTIANELTVTHIIEYILHIKQQEEDNEQKQEETAQEEEAQAVPPQEEETVSVPVVGGFEKLMLPFKENWLDEHAVGVAVIPVTEQLQD